VKRYVISFEVTNTWERSILADNEAEALEKFWVAYHARRLAPVLVTEGAPRAIHVAERNS
jgi:hypothetical protein